MRSSKSELRVQHEYASCNLSVGETRLEVNSKPFYEKLGRYMPDALYQRYASLGRQGVIEGIGRRLRLAEMFNKDGARMNVVAQIGKEAMFEPYELVVGLEVTPPADIRLAEKGELQGQNDTGSFEMSHTKPELEINYNKGAVRIYQTQQASVRMWLTEGKYDIYA
jgi:hypothetical protein